MEHAVTSMLKAHRHRDVQNPQRGLYAEEAHDQRRIEKYPKAAKRIRDFLASNAERKNAQGKPLKSNVTDNQSAKIATANGVIQGYTAVAAVDSQHRSSSPLTALNQLASPKLVNPMDFELLPQPSVHEYRSWSY
jgi:hypothetical protein